MNRNTESHFSDLPQVDIERSIFDRSSEHKTSFNVGELIPFYWDEVVPGDTFNVTTSCVVRLQTLLTPLMDNVYLDTYYFFIPNRLTWNHWKEFMGENSESAWLPSTEYSVPYVSYPTGGFAVGSLADYMGIPVGVEAASPVDMPMALPLRAYALICNEWFRDQNVSDPLNIPLGDDNQTGSNGDNYITDVVNGGKPFKVAKYHDYFTSCLPAPQKGQAVGFDLGMLDGFYPVGTRHDPHTAIENAPGLSHSVPLNLVSSSSYSTEATVDNPNHVLLSTGNAYTSNSGTWQTPDNLWTKLEGLEGAYVTVNELRLAFQLQKYYEKNARAGTRYREILQSHFGVTSADARMMIPEYLGGHRFPLSIHQVENTSMSDDSFLGDLGAMSNTADVHEDFVKSFTEHGIVIGVCCVRYDHSYPQGLSREWSRKSKLDYYWPVFANLGEQPVKLREIMLVDDTQEGTKLNDSIFGYQEAWAEYRYKPSRVSGEMRPGIDNSLASWHLADYYTEQPSLSDAWIREDKANVDRALSVTSAAANQVFADFYIKNIATRPMPMYSVPGLIDHH